MDAFPVQVTIAGRLHTSCRLHTDGVSGVVWEWDYAANAAKVLVEFGPEGVLVVPAELGDLPWNLEHEGAPLVLQRQNGCGCGHPLARHVPERRPVREHTA